MISAERGSFFNFLAVKRLSVSLTFVVPSSLERGSKQEQGRQTAADTVTVQPVHMYATVAYLFPTQLLYYFGHHHFPNPPSPAVQACHARR